MGLLGSVAMKTPEGWIDLVAGLGGSWTSDVPGVEGVAKLVMRDCRDGVS